MAVPDTPAPKRRLKNPETFRERAAKASETTEKVGFIRRGWNAFKKIVRRIFRPVHRALKKLFSVQPFKTVAKIGHWVGLIVWPKYFRSSFKELKKVTWPNWKQSRRLTSAVIIFAVIFAVLIGVVDYGLDKLFKHLLLK